MNFNRQGNQNQHKNQIEDPKFRKCPVCCLDDDVRISGKKGNQRQYYCKTCGFYFIPTTVHSEHRKIWHDKIKYARIRMLIRYLGFKNKNKNLIKKSY